MKKSKEKNTTLLDNAARVCADRNFVNKSFFNLYILPVIRFINVIFLVLVVIMLAGSSFLFESSNYTFNGFFWIITLGITPLIANYIKNKIESKHEFFEWDKRERKKKRDFITVLTFNVFFFTYLSVFVLVLLYFDYENTELNRLDFDLVVKLFYGILFLLNSIFTVQLHNKLYAEYLIIDDFYYDISEKPKNWNNEYKRTSFDNFFDL